MRGVAGVDPGWGITAVRVAMAIIFIAAGYGKFTGGAAGVAGYFSQVAIPMPSVAAPLIIALELLGGIALLIGLFARWIGLLFAIEFIVAAFYVKMPAVGWAASRLDLMLLAGGILLFLAGPGRLAVDEMWLERPRALRERTV